MASGRNIKGITIELNGDITGLDKALKGVNSSVKSTQAQLKDVDRLLKLDPKNTELLSQKQRLLSDAVGETKTKLETLKEAEKQAQEQFAQGKISQEQYDALKREIKSTEEYLKSYEQQLDKCNPKLEAFGAKAQEFGEASEKAGKKMLPVTGAIVGVGAAAVKSAMDLDEGYDSIAKGTGATGEALEELKGTADNIFSKMPTDMGIVGTSIADVNTRFGLTGDALEDVSTKFIKFADVNNTDVSTSIANVSRYMGDAGIESSKAGEVLDQLTAASQASGISVDKLTENLTKYGAPMRALGFDTKESIAIFSSWEKAGVNTEIAFSGMKKAISNWSSQGKDSREEFKKTLQSIQDCPDIASATTQAIEVFGQKAGPDLADAIKGGRFEYEDFLSVLDGSAGTLENTFTATLDPWDEAKVAMNNLKLAGEDLGTSILSSLTPIMENLKNKVIEFKNWFSSLSDSQKEMVVKVAGIIAAIGPVLIIIGKVSTGISSVINVIKLVGPALAGISGPAIAVIGIVAAVIAIGVLLYKNWDLIKEKATQLKDWIVDKFTAIKDGVIEKVTSVKDGVVNKFTEIKDGVSEKVTSIKDGVSEKFTSIRDNMSEKMQSAKDLIQGKLDAIKGAYEQNGGGIKGIAAGAMEGVKQYYKTGYDAINSLTGGRLGDVVSTMSSKMGQARDAVGNILSNIRDGFRDKLDGAKEIVRGAIDRIKGFFNFSWSLPHIKLPHFSISGKFSLNPPKIPHFGVSWYKNGGIMTNPTMFGMNGNNAMVGGEAGAEAILPLDGFYRRLDSMLSEKLGRSETGGQTLVAYIDTYMDSKLIARDLTKSTIKAISRQQANELRTVGA